MTRHDKNRVALCCPRCAGDVALDLSAILSLLYRCQVCSWRGVLDAAVALKEGELVIASIDGEPVIATHMPEEYQDERGAFCERVGIITWVSMTWMGEAISTDGRDYVNLPCHRHGSGDLSLEQIGWLREALSANIIDRLIRIAHAYVNRPWPDAFVAPAPRLPYTPPAPAPTDPARTAMIRRAGRVAGDLCARIIDHMTPADAHSLLDAVEHQLQCARITKAA